MSFIRPGPLQLRPAQGRRTERAPLSRPAVPVSRCLFQSHATGSDWIHRVLPFGYSLWRTETVVAWHRACLPGTPSGVTTPPWPARRAAAIRSARACGPVSAALIGDAAASGPHVAVLSPCAATLPLSRAISASRPETAQFRPVRRRPNSMVVQLACMSPAQADTRIPTRRRACSTHGTHGPVVGPNTTPFRGHGPGISPRNLLAYPPDWPRPEQGCCRPGP